MVRFLMLTLALLATSTAAFAQYDPEANSQDVATGWVQKKEESFVAHIPQADGQPVVPFKFMATDIRFDPSQLDQSHMIISMNYTAPGSTEVKGGTFFGNNIRKGKNGTFEAVGKIIIGTTERDAVVPFTAAFDKNSPTPKLLIDGNMTLSASEIAGHDNQSVYPPLAPIQFHIVTEPLHPLAGAAPIIEPEQ